MCDEYLGHRLESVLRSSQKTLKEKGASSALINKLQCITKPIKKQKTKETNHKTRLKKKVHSFFKVHCINDNCMQPSERNEQQTTIANVKRNKIHTAQQLNAATELEQVYFCVVKSCFLFYIFHVQRAKNFAPKTDCFVSFNFLCRSFVNYLFYGPLNCKRVCFSAPVSLSFFFVFLFFTTPASRISLNLPMNYLFDLTSF